MSKRRLLIYHITWSILIIGFWVGFSFLLTPLYNRFWQGLKEFWDSLKVYGQTVFGIDIEVEASVNDSTFIDGFSFSFLPTSVETFFRELGLVFVNIISKGYWIHYANSVFPTISYIARALMVIFPILILLYILVKSFFSYHEPNVGFETKPHQLFMKRLTVYENIWWNIKDVCSFMNNTWYFKWPLIIGCLFFTNCLSIFIGFISWYIYFAASFDFVSIWHQITRLFTDLSYMLNWKWIPMWLILGFLIIKYLCKKKAEKRIQHVLQDNENFVSNKCSISTLFIGLMGKGKTTIMTDVGITTEQMFIDISYEKIVELNNFFPYFDFREYEVYLDRLDKDHKIYDLSYARKRISEGIFDGCLLSDEELESLVIDENKFVFYDDEFFNGYKNVHLKDVLVTYGLLYYLYNRKTSLVYSNYAVRSGIFALSYDHLTEYVNDFAKTDDEFFNNSDFSHILDFNNFRLGKKIPNRIEWSYSTDIGVFLFDEAGKERLNQVELEGIEKNSDDCNQKNDKFNISIKMGRHMATIDNYPFFKIYSSEQRMESVPADFRELNDNVIKINDSSEVVNLFPFYDFIDWLVTLIELPLLSLFKTYRFNRDEISLIYQYIKNILSRISRFKLRMNNKYACKNLRVSIFSPSGEELGTDVYHLLFCKIYSRRFTTDAYSDFFTDKGLKSEYGIDDVPTYKSHRATLDELKMQNSHFINGLSNIDFKGENQSIKQDSKPDKKKSKTKWVKL